MLIDSLKAIFRAAVSVLQEAAGCESESEVIVQIESTAFHFPQVAAAHYRAGPLRRLVVGCDLELTRHIAGLQATNTPTPANEIAGSAEEGLRILCRAFQAALNRELPGIDQTRELIVHDPIKFAVWATGERQFHLVLSTDKGKLELLVGMATGRDLAEQRGQSFGDKQTVRSRHLAEATIDLAEDVQNIVESLVTREEDIYLRMPSREGRQKVFNGTVLGFARDRGHTCEEPDLTLTTSCLNIAGCPLDGEKVAVIFFRRGRLLQFVSEVKGTTQVIVSQSRALALLKIAAPKKISPGQRRESFRIVPSEKLSGTIRSALALKGPGRHEKKHSVSFVVCDLSFTGALVEIQSNTLISGFRWGRKVECTFDLPKPYGAVTLMSVVRRLDLIPPKKEVRYAHMGLEFLNEVDPQSGSLERIRKYVLAQERLSLKRHTKLITNR